MQIILLHDVDKVGQRGQTVNVANGYARNFLFPAGMAVRADTAKTNVLLPLSFQPERETRAEPSPGYSSGTTSIQETSPVAVVTMPVRWLS